MGSHGHLAQTNTTHWLDVKPQLDGKTSINITACNPVWLMNDWPQGTTYTADKAVVSCPPSVWYRGTLCCCGGRCLKRTWSTFRYFEDAFHYVACLLLMALGQIWFGSEDVKWHHLRFSKAMNDSGRKVCVSFSIPNKRLRIHTICNYVATRQMTHDGTGKLVQLTHSQDLICSWLAS